MDLSQAQIDTIIKQGKITDIAGLADQLQNSGREIYTMVFDLSVARDRGAALLYPLPFKSFRVIDTTDTVCYVNFIPNGNDKSHGDGGKYTSGTPFISFRSILKGFFWWPAQAGKTLSIEFYRDSFTLPANFLSTVRTTTSSLTTLARPAASSAVAAILAAQDLTRSGVLVQNQELINSFWVGGANVTDDTGGFPGLEVAAGATYAHDCSAALYWVSKVAVTKVSVTSYGS